MTTLVAFHITGPATGRGRIISAKRLFLRSTPSRQDPKRRERERGELFMLRRQLHRKPEVECRQPQCPL